jgi:signal transduction histidine kinase
MGGVGRLRIPPRALIALVLVAVSSLFLLHESFTRRSFDASLAQVDEIVDDAMPSIVDLVEARQALAELRYALDNVAAVRGAVAATEARRLLDHLEQRVRDYEHLPSVPGEETDQRILHESVNRLRAATQAMIDEDDAAGARRLLGSRVNPAFNEVALAIGTLVEHDARATERVTRDALVTHAHAKETSLFFLAAILALVGALAVLVDRTIARAEDTAQRRIDELDAFAARVAHDLRGPLQPVLMALSIARREETPHEVVARAAEKGEHSVAQMRALIDALLAFARSGARPDPGVRSDLGLAIREVVSSLETLAEEEKARVVVEVEPGLFVPASTGVMASIVGNLARNALLYLGDADQRVVTIRARRVEKGCAIDVVDTGPGIAPDLAKRLFEPFQRGSGRPGGYGLGLATVARLVRAHGGKVQVLTRLGEGTTFRVSLDLA